MKNANSWNRKKRDSGLIHINLLRVILIIISTITLYWLFLDTLAYYLKDTHDTSEKPSGETRGTKNEGNEWLMESRERVWYLYDHIDNTQDSLRLQRLINDKWFITNHLSQIIKNKNKRCDNMTKVTLSVSDDGNSNLDVDSKDGISGVELINLFLNAAYAIAEDNGMETHEAQTVITEMTMLLGEE